MSIGWDHPVVTEHFDPRRVILIGASTGGIAALSNVLQRFPASAPPTLIVQHTSAPFNDGLLRLLQRATRARVESALHGAPLRQGVIQIAPADVAHLRLSGPAGSLRCTLDSGAKVHGHRPSVDVLFQSAVPFATRISAAILTGMGQDGAIGIAALRHAGAVTIGQDAASSVIYGMPRVAHERGGVERQLPLSQIGPALLASCQRLVRA